MLLDLSLSQLSAMVYKETMLTPVIILNINQLNGLIIIECISIAIDAIEAKAAKTLICPTRKIKFGIVFAPIK